MRDRYYAGQKLFGTDIMRDKNYAGHKLCGTEIIRDRNYILRQIGVGGGCGGQKLHQSMCISTRLHSQIFDSFQTHTNKP
jgi:hypothetical protein